MQRLILLLLLVEASFAFLTLHQTNSVSCFSTIRRQSPLRPTDTTSRRRRSDTPLFLKETRDHDGDDDKAWRRMTSSAVVGLLAQPVVWISLYFVVTTGHGLPAGPWGLLGATEGLSYLVIVGFAAVGLVKTMAKPKTRSSSSSSDGKDMLGRVVERLSLASTLAGLLVLASLVIDRGCVPNAKPILDYSAYLPVCV